MARYAYPLNCNFAISADTDNSCAYHRIWLPFQYAKFTTSKPTLVFNRLPLGGIRELECYKELGFKIVCDTDDYWILPKTHYLHGYYAQTDMTRRLICAMELADVVITTTDRLAMKVREHNRDVVVIPNALPFGHGQFRKPKLRGEPRGFVYMAGESHRRDLERVAGVLNRLDVTLAGYRSGSPEWDTMEAAVPACPLAAQQPLHRYMRLLDGFACALAPLVPNTFNRYKSNLKVLEAGAAGIPIICSKTKPYVNDVDRRHVIYANSEAEWASQMRLIRTQPDLASYMGHALHEHVKRHYSLADANVLRQQVFTSL